jgi:hypothetical protein
MSAIAGRKRHLQRIDAGVRAAAKDRAAQQAAAGAVGPWD